MARRRQTARRAEEDAGDAAASSSTITSTLAGGAADRGADNGRLRLKAMRDALRSESLQPGRRKMECCKFSRLRAGSREALRRGSGPLESASADYDDLRETSPENHPGDPIMSREEFFLERQGAHGWRRRAFLLFECPIDVETNAPLI